MRAAMLWCSGFGMFGGLLCAKVLPIPDGDVSGGVMVIIASMILAFLAVRK